MRARKIDKLPIDLFLAANKMSLNLHEQILSPECAQQSLNSRFET